MARASGKPSKGGLKRKKQLRRSSKPLRKTPLKRKFKPPGIKVPAHQDQRDAIKVRKTKDGRTTKRCVVCGESDTSPMHVVPRHCGGCPSPLCTLQGCHKCHAAYDGRAVNTNGSKKTLNLLESLLLKRYRNTKNLTDPPTDPDEFARRLQVRYRPHFWHATKHVKFSDLRVALMHGSDEMPIVDPKRLAQANDDSATTNHGSGRRTTR